MAIRYFFKGILSQNVVKDRAGRSIPWERLNGNQGVIALDPATAGELVEDLAAIKGTRGVIEVQQEAYQAIKKKSLSIVSPKKDSGLPPVRVRQTDLSLKKRVVQSAAPASPASEAPPANTVPAGGDKQLAAASVPTKPVPRLGHARPIHFQGVPVPAPEPVSDIPAAPPVLPAELPAVVTPPLEAAPVKAPVETQLKAPADAAPAAPKRRGRPPKKAAEPVMA